MIAKKRARRAQSTSNSSMKPAYLLHSSFPMALAPLPALAPRRCKSAWCMAWGEGSKVRILPTKASHIKPLNLASHAWERRRLAGDFFGLQLAGGDAGAPRAMRI